MCTRVIFKTPVGIQISPFQTPPHNIKTLLSPMVLAIFSFWHQFCFMSMIRFDDVISNSDHYFCTYPEWIFNVFILTLLGVVFAKVRKRQRQGGAMMLSRALMLKKRRCAQCISHPRSAPFSATFRDVHNRLRVPSLLAHMSSRPQSA